MLHTYWVAVLHYYYGPVGYVWSLPGPCSPSRFDGRPGGRAGDGSDLRIGAVAVFVPGLRSCWDGDWGSGSVWMVLLKMYAVRRGLVIFMLYFMISYVLCMTPHLDVL